MTLIAVLDIVRGLVGKLSGTEPRLFQRDGFLYAVSPSAFGMVRPGLNTNLIEKIAGGDREYVEIKKEKWGGEKRVVTDKKEAKYFAPIAFGDDSNTFCFDDVRNVAVQLAKLPNDGKIRIIYHDSQYHSHKYGYACEGIDVWAVSAKVMDVAHYLEILRTQEKDFFRDFGLAEARKSYEEPGRTPFYHHFQNLIPEGIIMTPNIIASFPRGGQLRYHERNIWTGGTRLSPDFFVLREEIPEHKESPFALYIYQNANNASSKGEGGFRNIRRWYCKNTSGICSFILSTRNIWFSFKA